MKKITLTIVILALLFLTGCGWLFSLNSWTVPDILEFAELAESLNTPPKIGAYMSENFTYEEHKKLISPYILSITKLGDCNDFATFGLFMSHYNGNKAYIILVGYNGDDYSHAIAVYVEDEGMSITDNTFYWDNYGLYFNSFREIAGWDNDKWTKYKVYDWNGTVEKVEK